MRRASLHAGGPHATRRVVGAALVAQLAAIKREEVLLIEQQEELERDKAVLLKQLKLIRDEVRAPQRPAAQTCYAQRALDNAQKSTVNVQLQQTT